jgi:hypothetical protein
MPPVGRRGGSGSAQVAAGSRQWAVVIETADCRLRSALRHRHLAEHAKFYRVMLSKDTFP